MRITYPVPAQTSSVFVVVTDRTPTELSSIVPWRMGPSHRRAARDALGTDRLRLEAFRSARSPWRRMDLRAEDLKRVRRARYHVVVTGTAPVAEQPEAAQVVRAAARGIAEAYHGVVYDPLTGAGVYHCSECPGEREDFHLGDDWLGWRLPCIDEETCRAPGAGLDTEYGPGVARPGGRDAAGAEGGAEGARIGSGGGAGTGGCVGGGSGRLVTTSRGLRRFGMPEIALAGLACAHDLCAVTVLRTVAEAVLGGHLAWLSTGPASLCRTLDGRLRLAGAEFAVVTGRLDEEVRPAGGDVGWSGVPGPRRGSVGGADADVVLTELLGVRLTPGAAARSCLKIGRPGGHDDGSRHPRHAPGLLVA